jgi:hypothetical protein
MHSRSPELQLETVTLKEMWPARAADILHLMQIITCTLQSNSYNHSALSGQMICLALASKPSANTGHVGRHNESASWLATIGSPGLPYTTDDLTQFTEHGRISTKEHMSLGVKLKLFQFGGMEAFANLDFHQTTRTVQYPQSAREGRFLRHETAGREHSKTPSTLPVMR